MDKLYYNPRMTDAWKKTIKDVIIILFIGFIYFLIYKFTGWGLPCAFKTVTGLPCPSCGISHMFIHLTQLDFKRAFHDNQFLFFTWPLAGAEIVYIIYRLNSNKDLPKANIWMIGIFTALLVTFGILRLFLSWY